jgi:hypothetical protein
VEIYDKEAKDFGAPPKIKGRRLKLTREGETEILINNDFDDTGMEQWHGF